MTALLAVGRTPEELASLAGVKSPTIKAVVRGVRNLGPKATERLAKALGMTAAQFSAPADEKEAPATPPASGLVQLNQGRNITNQDRFLKDAVEVRGAIEPDLLTRAFVNEVRSLADMKYLDEEVLARRAFGESPSALARWREIAERRTGLTLAEAARLACALETDLADLLSRVTDAVRRYAKPGELRSETAPYHQLQESPAPYPAPGRAPAKPGKP